MKGETVMLQFITGAAGSGKTEYIYNEIESRIRDGLTTWVLVPEQFSLFMEKELIGRFGMTAQTSVKVLSFSRLCNLVLSKTGPLRMKYIDGAGKQIIAAQVMQKLRGKLGVMGKNLRQQGFAQVLASTVSEFKRYGVPPQALRFAAENTDIKELAAKLDDLALIYETYNNLLEQQSADAEDNLSLICGKLRNCDFLSGKMYIMHFRSFTPIEHRAIGELMYKADICFAADYSESGKFAGLFYPVGGTIRRLKETAEAEGTEVLAPIALENSEAASDAEYLRDEYFNPSAAAREESDGSVSIYEVQNRYREIESAADLILRLCREENRRFNDFLVLARETESYSNILPAIFEKRGIKVFSDTGRRVSSKPMMRLLSGMLEVLAYGPSYERVMSMARTGLYDIDADLIDMLDNYILAAAPSHAMWQAERWEYNPGRGGFDMESINLAKDTILGGVNSIKGKISGTKTGGEIAEALLDWLKNGGLADMVADRAQACLDRREAETAEEYRLVWNTAVSVLAQIAKIMEDTKMTYTEFAELFKNACDGTKLNLAPQTLDCVMFSQIDRFRSSGKPVVLVLGMNEGVFPKGHMTEGLISDAERSAMAELGVELAPGADSKRREEQLLIYAVLSAARERLIFFRALEKDDGSPLQGSEVLRRTAELIPATKIINPDREGGAIGNAEGTAAVFEALAAQLAEYGGDSGFLSGDAKELYRWFEQNGDYGIKLKNLSKAMSSGTPERLSAEMAEKLYGKPLYLSASQLETYNSCAFKYFLTYGLFAREREKAGAEPRSMGSVQHAALYDYFTELKNEGADPSAVEREDCFRRVGEAVELEAKKNAELLYESSAYYKYIVMRMKGIAARTAWEVLKFYRSSEFRPYGFEIKIGLRGDIPALSVQDGQGREIAKIRGLIDRADTARAGDKTLVSVIDYKSSAKGLDVKLAEDGITIQPLLYTSALCGGIENACPAAMVYMQMNDPIIEENEYIKKGAEAAFNDKIELGGWIADDPEVIEAYTKNQDKNSGKFMPSGVGAVVEADELKRRIKAANERICKSALAIAGGKIEVNPYRLKGKHDACRYCAFGGVCGHGE